jgi:hypothetical protein
VDVAEREADFPRLDEDRPVISAPRATTWPAISAVAAIPRPITSAAVLNTSPMPRAESSTT